MCGYGSANAAYSDALRHVRVLVSCDRQLLARCAYSILAGPSVQLELCQGKHRCQMQPAHCALHCCQGPLQCMRAPALAGARGLTAGFLRLWWGLGSLPTLRLLPGVADPVNH
jgi:hypothetical protein